MNPARNLILVGPMGAGKTCIGRRLAERFALRFVDADREVEARTGTDIPTIFAMEGEAGFRARERATLHELLQQHDVVLATGGGAVLDAGVRRALRAGGFVVHLHVAIAQQLERLARDRTRPLLARDDREDVLRTLAAEREPLYAEVADLRFDTGTLAAADAAAALGRRLERDWRREAAA